MKKIKKILLLASLPFFCLGALRLYYGHNPIPVILKALPIPSTILGPPKGYIFAKEAYPEKYKAIVPAYEVTYPPFPFSKNQEPVTRVFPEVFVVELENARAFENRAIIISEDDQVLADTALDWHYFPSFTSHSIFRKDKFPKAEYFDERVVVLASKGTECYFHWMFDILPRLEVLKRAHIEYDKIYLNRLKHPYQKETLAHLGIDENKIIWAEHDRHIRAKKLIIPAISGGIRCSTPAWSASFLKESFLKHAPENSEKKIYVSRKLAAARRIINEDELIRALEKRGFVEVLLEKLSILEQAELFASAKYIVAPHGAGLTNLVFCQDRTHLIEIYSPQHLIDCYWNLTHDKNMEHLCLLGSEEGLSEAQKKSKDIYVNVDEVLNLLPNSI